MSTSSRARTSPSSRWPNWFCDVVGFKGRIVTDTTKLDGTPRKLMGGERL